MQKALIQAISKRPLDTLKGMKAEEIAKVVQYANYQYYNSDKPVFTDNVFDIIKEHLQEIDPYNPILKHVGAIVEDDERKVKLPYWMGSMDKIKSDSNTVKKWVSGYDGNVVISDKLDGVSGLFYWKNGSAKLFTRGNGEEGQTITHLLPFILNIPDLTKFKKYKEFTVRGELIINRPDFIKVKNLGANGRNMVSGLLNAKMPNLEIAKLCQFIAYEMIVPNHEPSQQNVIMRDIGFKVVNHTVISTNTVSTETLSSILGKRRQESEFEIDGIIIMHDGIHNRKSGENPKHAFAFKSVAMMDRAEVVVTSVEWNISKDGYIKPVVLFDPVSLSGAMVRRATGFNAKFIVDNNIGAGAKIVVMRSGDVIPYIIETVEKAKPDLPDDIKFVWNETGIDIIADAANSKNEILLKNLEFFFANVKVTGVSEGILKKFVAIGLDSVGKIIKADKKQLLSVEGFKEKMADKILSAISERFSEIDPLLLMKASNAFGRGLGERKLKMIHDQFPQLTTDEKFSPSIEELVKIDGIEKKTAMYVIQGLSNYWKFAKDNDLVRYHKNTSKKNLETIEGDKEQIFNDKGFLFTGVRNKEVEKYITDRGGKIKSSISKNVHVLICKDKSIGSSKLTEAKEMGIEIMTLEEFIKDNKI